MILVSVLVTAVVVLSALSIVLSRRLDRANELVDRWASYHAFHSQKWAHGE